MGSVKRFVTRWSAVAAFLGLLVAAQSAAAFTCTYSQYVGASPPVPANSWDDARNWTGCNSTTPQPGNVVIIAGGSSVKMSAGSYVIASLNLDGTIEGATMGSTTLTITANDTTLEVSGGTSMTFKNLTVDFSSAVSTFAQTDFFLDGAMFNNAGELYLSRNATLSANSVFNNNGNVLTGFGFTYSMGPGSVFNNGIANGNALVRVDGPHTIDGAFNNFALLMINDGNITLTQPSLFTTASGSSRIYGSDIIGGTITTANADLALTAGSIERRMTFSLGTGTLYATDMYISPFTGSASTLTVNGNLVQTRGQFNTWIYTPTSYDQMVVGGNATINDVSLWLVHQSGYWAPNGTALYVVTTGPSKTLTSNLIGQTVSDSGFSYIISNPNEPSGLLRLTQTGGPTLCDFLVPNGAWNNPANWGSTCAAETRVPGQTDRVVISGQKTVTLGTESVHVSQLDLNNARIIGSSAAGSQIAVDNGGTWTSGTTDQNQFTNVTVTFVNGGGQYTGGNSALLLTNAVINIESGSELDVGNVSLTGANAAINNSGSFTTFDTQLSMLGGAKFLNKAGGNFFALENLTITGPFENKGIFDHLGSTTITLPDAASFTQTDLGAIMLLKGTWTGTTGTLTLDNGQVRNGRLNSFLNFTDIVNNGATIFPSRFFDAVLSPSTITIQGNYTQGSGGKITAAYCGSNSFDVVNILGDAALAGTLEVAIGCNYTASFDESFQPLNYTNVSGTFSTITPPSGFSVSANYAYGEGMLLTLGEPVLPAASISPSTVTFSTTQPVGVAAAAQTVTITNTGTPNIVFAPNFGLVDVVPPTPFSIGGGTCVGATLTTGQSCVISIGFFPTVADTYSYDLITFLTAATTNGTVYTPSTVPITGTAAYVAPVLATTNYSFSSTPVGGSIATTVALIANSGATGLTITSTGAPFSVPAGANNCLPTVAAGVSCTFDVVFQPTAVAGYGGSITVGSNEGAIGVISVSGSSTAPSVSFTPASITHPSTTISASDAIANQVFTNTSTVAITLAASNALTGSNPQFVISSGSTGTPCANGLVIAAGDSCTYTSTFTPTVVASFGASYTIAYTAASVPFSANLSVGGSSLAPTTSFTPASLTHPTTVVGQPNVIANQIFTNTSDVEIALAASNAFTSSNPQFAVTAGSTGTPCTNGLLLSAGTSCTYTSTFTPTSVASFGASYTVNYSVLGAVNFTATVGVGGSSVAPTTSFTPSSISHGSVPVGSPSLLANLTFTNSSPVTITLAASNALTSPSGQFVITPGSTGTPCTNGLAIAAGASCTFNSTYTPSGVTSISNSYTFNYAVGAATFSNTVGFSGAGIAAASVAPTTIPFGNVPLTVGVTQTVTFSNPSGVPVRLVSITHSDARYTSVGNGGSPCTPGNDVLAGGSCTYALTFTPTGTGSYNNTSTIVYQPNATGPTYNLTQNANGTGVNLPSTITPSSIAFGNTTIGTTLTQVGLFANTSNSTSFPSTYTITALSTTGLGFSAAGSGGSPCNVGATVAPGASCTFTETFLVSSGSTGSYNGTTQLDFQGGQGANPTYSQVVNANATIVTAAPGLVLSTTSLTFATPQAVSTSSAALPVTLTNTGNTTINLTLPFIASGDFTVATTCGATLAPAGTCTASVTFTPTTGGTRTGQMSITSTAPTSPDTVLLSGTATAPPLFTSAAPPAGVVGVPYTFTFTASGNPASTWSLLSGTLPTGLSLNSVTGVLSGTPTTPGTFVGVVQASNGVGVAPEPVSIVIDLPQANVEIFNTGVDAAGGLLAPGSVDPHYQLTVSADATMPGPAAYVANPIPTGYWLANGPASQWIAPAVDQSFPNPPATCNAAGNYTYRTKFDLTGFSLPSVVLNGNWAADNSGISILLNGNATGAPGAGGYGAFSAFTLSTGFVSGINTLDFVINDSGCPSGLRVELSGTGTATTASYSPALGLSFGNVTQSTTSAPLQAVFTNTSPVALSLSSLSFVGGGAGFNILGTSQCLATPTLAPGASCTFDVTATPATTGVLTDAIRVVTTPANAGAPSVLGLSVTAVPVSAAGLSISTGALSFGNVVLTQSSTKQTLTLTNTGNATLNFTTAFAVTSDYTFTTTCGSTLAASGTCTVDVTFSPTAVGVRTGTLTILSDAPTSPDVVSLGGTGAALPTLVSFSTASVAPGGTVDLVMKLTNFANHPAIAGASVLLNYPAGFTNQAQGAFPQAGCSSTLDPYTTGGNSASVSGGFLGAVGSGSTNCNLIWVKVTAPATPGIYTITIPAGGFTYVAGYSFSNAAPITFNVTVTTLTAPTLTFSAAPSTIAAGSPAVGTLTVTNPNAVPLTANPFTFNYAPGIVNAVVPNASSTCLGVTPSAAPGAGSSATTTGFTIPASSSCTFSVSITSATPGVYSGNITAGLIVTNGGSTNTTPFSLTVTSGGVAPSISSGPPASGTVGQAYSFSFAATGTPTITWSLVTGSLPPGLALNSSSGAVTGTPTAAGNFAFTVRATNTAGLINLSTAISVASPITSIMSLSTNTLNFGNQNVDVTSAAQSVAITNTGTGPFSILSFSGTGDFNFTSNCPLSPALIQPNATCNLSVTFTPLVAGPGSGRISVNNNAAQQGTNGTSISLSGTGVTVPRANIVVNPSTSLTFGDQAVGSSSAPVVVFVSNTGQAVMELQNVVLSGSSFTTSAAVADNPRGHPLCVTGNTIAPGASCAMAVTFSPVAIGTLTGRIAITHNATPTGVTGTTNINFTGTGSARREPLIRVSGTVAFSDQILGTASEAQPATITNIGTAPLNVTGLNITPTTVNTNATDFAVSGACDALQPNASCTVGVSFRPTGSVGPKGATLTVASNATNAGPSTSTIAMLGNAIPAPAPKVQLNPTTVGFGTVLRGTLNATTTLKVINSGQLPLTITRIDGIPNAAGFSPQSNDCVRTIGVGEFCTIVIRFAPNGPGAQRGELSIISNAPTSPDRVPLTGTGCTLVSPTFRFFVPNC